MAKIHFLCTTLVNGVSRNFYVLAEGERVSLLLLVENSFPLITSLFYKKGEPYADDCMIIKGERDYYLKPEERKNKWWQQAFTRGGEEVLATVYSEHSAILCVDYQNSFINYNLQNYYEDISFACDNFCNNIILFAKKNEKTRIIVVNISTNDIVLDIVCSEYTLSDTLNCTILYNDLVKRKKKIIVEFERDGVKIIERVFECESVHMSTPAQIKLSFLQGVYSEDYDYAKKLLSDDLLESFGEILSFLGKGGETIPLSDNEFLYGDKIISFECENDKITDISSSE